MNKRLRELRRTMGMTQQEFAVEIGVGKSSVESYEYGRRALTDRNIHIICQKFNVSEKWLRDGEGEMWEKENEDLATLDKLAYILTEDATNSEDLAFQKSLLKALVGLDANELNAIRKFIEKLVKKEEDL